MKDSLSARIQKLRVEMLVLRAAERALAERIRNMERRVSSGAPRAEPLAHESPSLRTAPIEPSVPAPVAAPAVSEPVASAAPVETVLHMALPNKQAISSCLDQLLGEALKIDVSRKAPPSNIGELEALWASLLLDETGRDVGVILVNARAAAELGGALLGLPQGAIDEQLSGAGLSGDTVEAMSEICNNLGGTVNRAGGCHVRAEALCACDPKRLPWLGSPLKTCQISTDGGGEIWLVAR